jgi:hypothetical protein
MCMIQYDDLLKTLLHKLMCTLNHMVTSVKCKALRIFLLSSFCLLNKWVFGSFEDIFPKRK